MDKPGRPPTEEEEMAEGTNEEEEVEHAGWD